MDDPTTESEGHEPVRELRLVVTATDFDEALHFYRDVLGLPERAAFSEGGRVSILEAGSATLELADPPTRSGSTTSRWAVGSPVSSGWRSLSRIPGG